MNKWMLGSAMGFVVGVGLMMTSAGRTIRKDVQKGMNKAKKIVQEMDGME